MRSDWLLKFEIVSAIYLPAFFWSFSRVFPHFLKEETIWGWLSTGLVNTKIIIHFSVGEEHLCICLYLGQLLTIRELLPAYRKTK